MAKRPSLATAKVKPNTAAALRALAEPPAESSQPPAPPTAAPKTFRAATREGLKKVTVGLRPDEHEELKVMAARQRRTVEELLREAIADLFAKHAVQRS